ncbi:MAG: metallophosphoesterase [Oculatellaceae cyanobacterium bins.114]|nr:metallophosphoesterase [Oculatellaceae cyanobacterium bins.114]
MHKLLTGSLKVERVTVPISELPTSLNNLRIAQLSDFHYDGLRLSESLLAEAIALTNDYTPDLIALTGDFVTDDPTPIHALSDRLKGLQSRVGVYAVLGNHDSYLPQAQPEIVTALERIGIRVLQNQIAYPVGERLPLVGFADFWSGKFDPTLLNQLDPAIPRLVLSHNPDTAAVLRSWRVDLQLSGHTHGGQVVLPKLGPLPAWGPKIRRLIPKSLRRQIPYMQDKCHQALHHWEWSEGLHRVGSNWLYVNRGLGTYLPGRLFCPPEVSLIKLVRA